MIRIKKSVVPLFFLLLIFSLKTTAQVSIIPKPNEIKYTDGKFSYAKGVDIKILRGDDATKRLQKEFINFVKEKNIAVVPFFATSINLNLLQATATDIPAEGYTLAITPNAIFINSSGNAGLFYGMQSLFQILKADTSKTLPCLEINDRPAYAYRGFHLDVSRHFFGVDVVKQYLDAMAKLKLNRFHWHLTDDQGWRIEIKKYPKLTEISSCRTEKDGSKYCGFYTQEDIRQIVQYAADRNIQVIPEIDIPGHSSAIIAAYPEFGCYRQSISVPTTFGVKKDILCPSDSTFQFLKEVLDEICTLFPSPYIHIGGDEIPIKHWEKSEAGKTFSREKNIAANDISSYFLKEIEIYLKQKGKKCIGWGEIMNEKLSKNITVMSWRGVKAGVKAAQQGNDVVMTPRTFCYFDYPQDWGDSKEGIFMTYLPLEKTYAFNPQSKIKGDAAKQHILGGQACMWTEYVDNKEKLQDMVFPRIIAMSECLWTKKENKKFSDFEKRRKVQKNYFYIEKEMPKIDMVRIKPKKEN